MTSPFIFLVPLVVGFFIVIFFRYTGLAVMPQILIFFIPLVVGSVLLIVFPYTGLGRLLFIPAFLTIGWLLCFFVFFIFGDYAKPILMPTILCVVMLLLGGLSFLPQVDNRSPIEKLLDGDFPTVETIKESLPFGTKRKAKFLTTEEVFGKKQEEQE